MMNEDNDEWRLKMMEKLSQTSPIEDDGEIFADISDWKIMCIQRLKGSQMLNNKTFSIVPDKKGILFMGIIWWDSIVSEPAVAPLFSNSIYIAAHQKIHMERIFLLFSKAKMLRL